MALIPTVLSTTPPVNLNVRRSVSANFFPPSSADRADYWSGTGNSGGLMLARSVLWTSKKTSGTINVLFEYADSFQSWVTNSVTNISNYVSASLPGVTMNITLDSYGANIGTLTTSNYDVCILVANGTFSSTVGTQVNNFCAAGGGLVITTFTTYQTVANLNYPTYTPITGPSGTFQAMSMNTANIVTHPITTGLSSLTFSNGTSGYCGNSISLSSGASNIVLYTTGSSLVAVKEVAL